MSTDFHFYVYAYLRKDGTPYYVGKGKNKRAWVKHGYIKTPQDKKRIVILEKNLSNIGAFALERRYIQWYGRKDLNNGILHNKTDGGEGASNVSEITRKKLSKAQKGIPNKPMSVETKLKISQTLKGIIRGTMPDEVREKISKSKKGKITEANILANKRQSSLSIGKKLMTREDGIRYWSYKAL
jgi:hypothetical protein